MVANLLMMTGDAERARSIVEGMAPADAADSRHWWTHMRIVFWSGDYEGAIALLNTAGSRARSPAARLCWRQAADALRRQTPSAGDLVDLQACVRTGDLAEDQAVQILSMLGDLDGAFALARASYVDARLEGHAVLFAPAAARMRADPRFMQLMHDLGLVRYWRLSDRWPDFCADDNLPYECRAEARRLQR